MKSALRIFYPHGVPSMRMKECDIRLIVENDTRTEGIQTQTPPPRKEKVSRRRPVVFLGQIVHDYVLPLSLQRGNQIKTYQSEVTGRRILAFDLVTGEGRTMSLQEARGADAWFVPSDLPHMRLTQALSNAYDTGLYRPTMKRGVPTVESMQRPYVRTQSALPKTPEVNKPVLKTDVPWEVKQEDATLRKIYPNLLYTR